MLKCTKEVYLFIEGRIGHALDKNISQVGQARRFESPGSRVHSHRWKLRWILDVWPRVVAFWSAGMFHQLETAKTQRVSTSLGEKELAGSEL